MTSRFASMEEYLRTHSSDKHSIRPISKILVANNGNAAVKCIKSLRSWSYQTFGAQLLHFVVMATPEDLKANAEYIRAADYIVDVPGKGNQYNYANVQLIVDLAVRHQCHAVWAGWGHASENPDLPDSLSQQNIAFIGPQGSSMYALGDKIGSTILAQTAGVPCIKWNGDGVRAEYNAETGSLPVEALEAANLKTVEQAQKAAEKVGVPLMLKASQGGGGKGIRKVMDLKDVATAFRQVQGEVPGSPIFGMRLAESARHLEVQLVADHYGQAIALGGRDCSVQRRHQKILEEGPPVAAHPDVWPQMLESARQLALAVGYQNAGTVEYLYDEGKYYFLELNPRLQVEHPVTEMICNVNLPAIQLQISMGLPLEGIPDIRNYYQLDGEYASESVNWSTVVPRAPAGHCMAVRITAENPEQGFSPTSGVLRELNFRSTPSVWGYFGVDSSGSIHEFADSQFGHLFARGESREDARRHMVHALKNLSIRGDISTTVDYISKLMELPEFVGNQIDTAWLDGIIQSGALTIEKKTDHLAASSLDHTYVVLAATLQVHDKCHSCETEFNELLEKGQLPPPALLTLEHSVELILRGIKYSLDCTKTGPLTYSIALNNKCVHVHVRALSDGGLLVDIGGGSSHVVYLTRKGDATTGMRMATGAVNVVFEPDYDPSSLRTDVAGKLVKQLVPDGEHLEKGQPYAEIEVMKMFLPLKVEESGTIQWNTNEGAAIHAGQLLASLELDNPEGVAKVVVFEGELDVSSLERGGSSSATTNDPPHLALRRAVATLDRSINGYILTEDELDVAMADILKAVKDPELPVLEVQEQLSVLSGRLPNTLFDRISEGLASYKSSRAHDESVVFPAVAVLDLLAVESDGIVDASTKSTFEALITPLREAVLPYSRGQSPSVPGAQRAVDSFLGAMENWIANERWFCDGKPYADVVEDLRQGHKNDPAHIHAVCRAHGQLKTTASMVQKIIHAIGVGSQINPAGGAGSESVIASAASALSEIGSMGQAEAYREVALRARQLLVQESKPSVEERKRQLLSAASSSDPQAIEKLVGNKSTLTDIIFSLVKSTTDLPELVGLVDVFMRNLYRNVTMQNISRDTPNQLVKFSFVERCAEGALSNLSTVLSLMDLKRVVSSGSLSEHGDESESSVVPTKQGIPADTVRTCVCAIIDGVGGISGSSPIWEQFPPVVDDPVNMLYLVVRGSEAGLDEDALGMVAKQCEDALEPCHGDLMTAGVRSVTFVVDKSYDEFTEYPAPALFTFRFPKFKEVPLYRGIDPVRAPQLDLKRVASNFDIKSMGAHNTSTGQTHLYEATPRREALLADKKARQNPRVFVRSIAFVADVSTTSFDRVIVDSLNIVDLCSVKSRSDNHMFINLVSDYEEAVLDPVQVEQVVAGTLKKYGDRITGMGIVETEIRIVCRLSADTHPIALRLVASNPTGYVHVMSTYVEAAEEGSDERVFKLIGNTKATLASTSDSSWESLSVSTPYPLTRPFDAQRRTALRASDTLYCYDLPALFEAAVEQQWTEASLVGGIEGGIRAAGRPAIVMQTTELVVTRKDNPAGIWSMQNYLDGKLNLTHVRRGAGMNDVGMVAWLVNLKTVEYPLGRDIVLISNDITHKAGSFGTREDVVFKMASEFARQRKIPRLFVAANAGARIGLAESVKKLFKVAFKDPDRPENGFDFLYVHKDEYDALTDGKDLINAVPFMYNGEIVYKIVDIIGSEPDLGVENLKGSGLIAGETSIAYDEIFTMSIVLGRTVGIGAYLVRLGQRTIQRKTESPIILTGFQALNKLMGVDVYSTHDQLGGPGIMYNNGISHMVEPDHFRAIKAAVKWLSFVPSTRHGLLPISDIRGVDELERPIGYTPVEGVPYDPRLLLTGGADESGAWKSGFFDKGTFVETMAGWAKAVVTGRARLGGIPMGVIVTENRTVESIKPADPADATASEQVVREAGGVWFPNSAQKTATAIRDFCTEDLPLIVFANWRGFSGGQRDMFDEVLKFGSHIVDAFCKYQQPVFCFIPPFAEIRGGAWVVLDATINANCMEMYASKGTARGGVLEANGTASVKYREKDLITTMHRLDDGLKSLTAELNTATEEEKGEIRGKISFREHMLLPVYEQIAVKFCELHDTPGRMKAVGVIRQDVEWKEARSFFYWRVRRKLAEFDLRNKVVDASRVGRSAKPLSPRQASNVVRQWFQEISGSSDWEDDKQVLSWMAQNHGLLEEKIIEFSKQCVSYEVFNVLTGGGTTGAISAAGIAHGIARAVSKLPRDEGEKLKQQLLAALK